MRPSSRGKLRRSHELIPLRQKRAHLQLVGDRRTLALHPARDVGPPDFTIGESALQLSSISTSSGVANPPGLETSEVVDRNAESSALSSDGANAHRITSIYQAATG